MRGWRWLAGLGLAAFALAGCAARDRRAAATATPHPLIPPLTATFAARTPAATATPSLTQPAEAPAGPIMLRFRPLGVF